MLVALVAYIIVSIIIVKLALSFESTDKDKKRARIVALVLVLWFPVLEPLGSFLLYQTYGFFLARATTHKTVNAVDRVYSDDPSFISRLPHVRDPRLRNSKLPIRRYAYFEYKDPSRGGYVEFDLIREVPIKTISKRTAKYTINQTRTTLQPFCEKRTIFIKDESGLVLGEYVEILWFGSHINQWLASITAGKGHSGTYYPNIVFRDFIQTVLVPSEQFE